MSIEKNDTPARCYLKYEFWYEDVHHKGCVNLDEETSNVQMEYDDHDFEITWIKRIRHKGRYIELSIVINDDAYDPDEGKVVASAWVCVYSLKDRLPRDIIDQFEPDQWSYIDESDDSRNVSKEIFYKA
ncbi:MAG: hypothetical protein MJ123_11280 [Lachnospiraceae bacterium]|nr:hypothetical protein [Lachnospiraceae bacterium]